MNDITIIIAVGLFSLIAGFIGSILQKKYWNKPYNPYDRIVVQGYQDSMLDVYQQIWDAHRREYPEDNWITLSTFMLGQMMEVVLKNSPNQNTNQADIMDWFEKAMTLEVLDAIDKHKKELTTTSESV